MRNRLVLMSALVLAAAACLPEGRDYTGPTNPYNLELRADPTSYTISSGDSISFGVPDNVFVYDLTADQSVGNSFPSISIGDESLVTFDTAIKGAEDEGGDHLVVPAGATAGSTTITATFQDLNRDTTLTLDIPVSVNPAP